MTGVQIQRLVTVPGVAAREQYWRGREYQRLVEDVAKDMGDQARLNITKLGEPGGPWAQLSGFNAATRKAITARAAISPDAWDVARKRMLMERRRLKARQSAAADAGGTLSPHSGYAKAKAEGRTPGAGKHGADVRLRDTDSMFDGMDGDTHDLPDGVVIKLVSRGTDASGVLNADKLKWHLTGTATMPARNPAADMALFEKRTKDRIREFLRNAPGANTSAVTKG